jgi:hypothetical protein
MLLFRPSVAGRQEIPKKLRHHSLVSRRLLLLQRVDRVLSFSGNEKTLHLGMSHGCENSKV